MSYEFNYKLLGFKGFSIKKSNTPGRLYHIRYAGTPVLEAFDMPLGYKVKITCNGHEKTYPHFTFSLEFSFPETKSGFFGPINSYRKVDIFDGNHDEFLNSEDYKKLTEILRIWSLELNSKFSDDFYDEYSCKSRLSRYRWRTLNSKQPPYPEQRKVGYAFVQGESLQARPISSPH
jgi:hypothetical protein